MAKKKQRRSQESIDREMWSRATNFLNALRNPLKRFGDKGRTADPEWEAPEPKIVERFEQVGIAKEAGVSVKSSSDSRKVDVKINADDPEDE